MSNFEEATERLLLLIEGVCRNLGNARLLTLEDIGSSETGTRIIRVMRDGREVKIKIENSFLDESGDDTVISYITTAITMSL